MDSLRQQMIAVSLAGGLCGATLATAIILIAQTAGLHASCSLGGLRGGVEALSGPGKPESPPLPPSAPT